ncbi:hypothetical protein JG676_01330 [Campylobacter sp. 2018MI35]|uniref:hypothetical protein n=1 Tax=Campylobacter sp. 2018MI34 TaxID=2800582 RepID=UPI0019037E68|nr:hypothetical protein [Campylobacter sp. 2018MI34]MBK1991256.1 hypothetical protein [Campylobacter sp. 2018MI34]
MKILLLNENPVVSKLVRLSAKKMSYDFEESNTYADDLGIYDIIIIDGDIQEDIEMLKQKCSKLIVLTSRSQKFDIKNIKILQKPFLPTDLLNLLNNDSLDTAQVFLEDKNEEQTQQNNDSIEENELSIDDLTLDEDEINQRIQDEKAIDITNEEEITTKDLSDVLELVHNDETNNDIENKDEKQNENLNDEDLNLSIQEETTINEENNSNNHTDLKNQDEIQDEKVADTISEEESIAKDQSDNLELIHDDETNDDTENKDEKQNENLNDEDLNLSIQEETTINEENNSNNHTDLKNQDEIQDEKAIDITNEEEITTKDLSDVLELVHNDETNNDIKENEKQQNISQTKTDQQELLSHQDDEYPIVEEEIKEIDFDDLPKDAEFLGQNKDEEKNTEDFLPIVEEELKEKENLDENIINPDLSAQDQIKEELAALDELDDNIKENDSTKILDNFKQESILGDEILPAFDNEELVVPKIQYDDFEELKESEIQQALGEKVTQDSQISDKTDNQDSNREKMVNELSQSIAQTISSSIKDDTLKAALKGMNMNINIKISFEDTKG